MRTIISFMTLPVLSFKIIQQTNWGRNKIIGDNWFVRQTITIFIIFLFLGSNKYCYSQTKEKSFTRPNIIYILADDLGYGDLSFLGQQELSTPNIDHLAEQGMTFTEHYAGAPVCAPSRCTLMTGQHTGHSVIRGNKFSPLVGVVPLNDDIITLPEAIKNKTNYTTAMCGRWHLGGELTNQTPFNRGFDYHFGKLSSDYGSKAGVMIDQLWDENGKHIPYERYSKLHIEPMYENGRLLDLTEKEIAMRPINMDELVTEKAVRYIKEKRENPFFLYIAFSLVHEPMEYHEKYPVSNHKWPEKERAFASMLQTLDSYIGKILSAVDVAGIQNNTVIIFTSDNGAHNEGGHNVEFFNSNGNFREYKRSLHEGGIRSPMIVRWPGVVKRGITSKHISAFWDIMPTLCNIAGAPIPSQTDGISFLPVLEGKETEQPKHDYLYWEFNESINFKKGQYKQAVREDDWKGIYYIDNNQFELYDLKNDITEENNVANQNPEIVQNLKQIMRIAHINSDRFPLLKEERGVK